MGEILYDYYPTLAAAKKAQKTINRKLRKSVAVIRKVFMSDSFVVYIKDEPSGGRR